MARQVLEKLIDDLDGSPANETIHFGLDTKRYEIDLNAKNAASLRKLLGPYITVARNDGKAAKSASRNGARPAMVKRDVDVDVAEVRQWARKRKIKVPQRGRLSSAIIEQYKQANGR